MIKEKRFYLHFLFYIITAVVLIFDLLTKTWTDGIIFQEAIKGVFAIESYHNTGASFSMFAGSQVAQILFIILGICVSVGLILYSVFSKNHK